MHDLWLNKKTIQIMFNTVICYDQILSSQYSFQCMFCGKEYGENVIDLAIHIGKVHDKPRNQVS